MPHGRLRECSRVGEQRGNAFLAARGVVPIDEVAEGIEGHVLGEGHAERQATRLDGNAAADFVEREPEDRAVDRVHRETEREPCRPSSDRLAQDGDIREVAAKEPLVDRLERAPDRGRHRSGNCRLDTRGHT